MAFVLGSHLSEQGDSWTHPPPFKATRSNRITTQSGFAVDGRDDEDGKNFSAAKQKKKRKTFSGSSPLPFWVLSRWDPKFSHSFRNCCNNLPTEEEKEEEKEKVVEAEEEDVVRVEKVASMCDWL